jgi:hypothetical protein
MEYLSRLHRNFLKFPTYRPGFVKAAIYGMSGASFAWGAIVEGETDPNKMKESLKAELTNTGILGALLLTITCGPLLNDPPSYVSDQINTYFSIWCVASLLLAYGVLVSVVELITIETFSKVEHLELFRRELGVIVHIPLYLLIAGGSIAILGIIHMAYYAVSLSIFFIGAIFAGSILLFVTCIFVKFVQTSWDAFNGDRIASLKAKTNETSVENNPMNSDRM